MLHLTEDDRKLLCRILGAMMDPSEQMIADGRWQSHHYPVVPTGYEDEAEPIHPFTQRHVFRAMIKSFAKEHRIQLPKER